VYDGTHHALFLFALAAIQTGEQGILQQDKLLGELKFLITVVIDDEMECVVAYLMFLFGPTFWL
jgi:hypothetical protein